jgi:peptidoglycan glycosyltransferase
MSNRPPTRLERQQRLKTRALPLVAVAFIAFILGMVQGCPGDPNRTSAEEYVKAWKDRDFEEMYAKLSTKSRDAIPLERFRERYERMGAAGTLVTVEAGEAEGDESLAKVPVTATTRAFGELEQTMEFTFGSDGIAWRNDLLFPGLEVDEELARETELPTRAPILTRDGQVMAKGPSLGRTYPLGDAMIDVTGTIGASEEGDVTNVAYGFDPGDPVGQSGLELAYNGRLAGKPGGTLWAVPLGSEPGTEGRELGSGEPKPARPLKTTIDPALQDSAVSNLTGRAGGVAVLDARNGQVRALAGQAYSVLQPPGSTMKIITATAALEQNKVKMDDQFEYATSGVADGREISNAHDEVCGGSFVESFADSCNSVFAPLAMEIGEEAFTETAEAFGFNRPPQIFNDEALAAVEPPTPSLPQPGDYNNELGVSGIGQGLVQATPLLMASTAQAIANRGEVSATPIVTEPALQPDLTPVRVSSKKTAAQVAELMAAVVTSGTGGAAAISEGQVAGKTGTAEVGPRAGGEVDEEGNPDLIEDAWFAGFAPSDKPKLAIGVMIIDATGDGGTVAAPIVSSVLSAGL